MMDEPNAGERFQQAIKGAPTSVCKCGHPNTSHYRGECLGNGKNGLSCCQCFRFEKD